VNEILANPLAAAVCGAIVGFASIAAVALSPKLVRSGDSKAATGVMMGAMGLSMVFILVVLLAYVAIAPESFLWFGLALAAGFVSGLAAMGVWMARTMSHEDQGR
jgi:hypothetical protein